jgi:hypothetical protein
MSEKPEARLRDDSTNFDLRHYGAAIHTFYRCGMSSEPDSAGMQIGSVFIREN